MTTQVKPVETVQSEEVCCPKFDPEPWDNTVHRWKDKLFIQDSVPEVFHFPLPGTVEKTVTRLWNKAQAAEAAPEVKDFLMLAYDPTPWRGEFLVAVTKEVPGAKNVKLSGTFISKVFDGPYSHIPKYIKQMDVFLEKQNRKAKRYFFYFTTCPKCAKKYGHNYIVTFAEI